MMFLTRTAPARLPQMRECLEAACPTLPDPTLHLPLPTEWTLPWKLPASLISHRFTLLTNLPAFPLKPLHNKTLQACNSSQWQRFTTIALALYSTRTCNGE